MVSGAAGFYSGTLVHDVGIRTDLVIHAGQVVSVTGVRSLPHAPLWGSGGFSVQERGALTLAYVAVDGALSLVGGILTLQSCVVSGNLSVTIGTARLSRCTLGDTVVATTSVGGSLSLASMAVPAAVLAAAGHRLNDAGSTLRLSAVTMAEAPMGELTGTMTVEADGSKAIDPPGFGAAPVFSVISGGTCTAYVDPSDENGWTGECLRNDGIPPCTVAEGGRCVGRAHGYGPAEECTIAVGGGGVLGDCAVFDLRGLTQDYITLRTDQRAAALTAQWTRCCCLVVS